MGRGQTEDRLRRAGKALEASVLSDVYSLLRALAPSLPTHPQASNELLIDLLDRAQPRLNDEAIRRQVADVASKIQKGVQRTEVLASTAMDVDSLIGRLRRNL